MKHACTLESCSPPDVSEWVFIFHPPRKGSVDFSGKLRRGTISLLVNIPFPASYPDTSFRRAHDEMATMLLSYNRLRNAAFLYAFYVHAAESDLATSTEKSAVKGLGKRMLCHTIHMLLERDEMTNDTVVSLEASGGMSNEEMVRMTMQRHTEAELDVFLSIFQEARVDEYIDERVHGMGGNMDNHRFRAKATIWCEYVNNQRLVRYYNTYGFNSIRSRETAPEIYFERMQGTVRDISRACSVPSKSISVYTPACSNQSTKSGGHPNLTRGGSDLSAKDGQEIRLDPVVAARTLRRPARVVCAGISVNGSRCKYANGEKWVQDGRGRWYCGRFHNPPGR